MRFLLHLQKKWQFITRAPQERNCFLSLQTTPNLIKQAEKTIFGHTPGHYSKGRKVLQTGRAIEKRNTDTLLICVTPGGSVAMTPLFSCMLFVKN